MIKLSDIIVDFKDSLILHQINANNSIPVTAFNDFKDIIRFCNKYNRSLIWNGDKLVIDYA